MTAPFKPSTLQSTFETVSTFTADNLLSDTWALGDYSCHKNGQQVDEEESDESDDKEEEE
jgi:hypothetical protein